MIVHRPSGVRAEASERRSQHENQQQAIFRLRVKLAIQVRSSPANREALACSELWTQRTIGGKIDCSRVHRDYPALLAEALDAVQAAEFDLGEGASLLLVSRSQLARWLGREPAAAAWINQQRKDIGLQPLRW